MTRILLHPLDLILQVLVFSFGALDSKAWVPLLLVFSTFVMGVILAQLLLPRIVRSTYLVQLREGSFRFFHGTVRTFAESIAFHAGGDKARAQAEQLFDRVYHTIRYDWMPPQGKLVAFMAFFFFFAALMSYISTGLGVFYFGVELRRHSSRTAAAQTLVQQISTLGIMLNLIPTCFTQLSTVFGLVNRVSLLDAQLLEILDSQLFLHPKTHTKLLSAEPSSEQHPEAVLPPQLELEEVRVYFPADAMELGGSQKSGPWTDGVDGRRRRRGRRDSLLREGGRAPLLPRDMDSTQDSARDASSDVIRPLFSGLSFTLPSQANLLIVGKSGVGKTSLLRVIAGLWPFQRGRMQRPSAMNFLAQRPYLSPGSLREVLLGRPGIARPPARGYADLLRNPEQDLQSSRASGEATPHPRLHIPKLISLGERFEELDSQEEVTWGMEVELLLCVLQQCRLEYLLDWPGLDGPRNLDWGQVLSLGEQQRLNFGKLFVQNVLERIGSRDRRRMSSVAVLDESTSALDEFAEECCIQGCQSLGIRMISISHRPQMLRFHEYLLVLRRNSEGPEGLESDAPLTVAKFMRNPYFGEPKEEEREPPSSLRPSD